MRRILYVDGFNFYYGVTRYWDREKHLPGLGWCDFRALIERHFPDASPLRIKYFSAPVTPSVELPQHLPGEHRRYSTWRRALQTVDDLLVVEGFYKRAEENGNPDMRTKRREEKQTDVNLAIEMIVDAFGPLDLRPKHVFILSGDCDQMPAIFALQERTPVPIRVTVLLPSIANQQRWEESYEKTRRRLLESHPVGPRHRAPGSPIEVIVLDEQILASSLLSYALSDPEGEFECPDCWKLPTAYLEQTCRNSEWRPDLRR